MDKHCECCDSGSYVASVIKHECDQCGHIDSNHQHCFEIDCYEIVRNTIRVKASTEDEAVRILKEDGASMNDQCKYEWVGNDPPDAVIIQKVKQLY